MTSVQTGSWIQHIPEAGATSVLIQNPAANDPVFVTQRLNISGTTEAADVTTDPGISVAAEREFTISGSAPFWIKGTNTQSVSICAFRAA